VPRRKNADVQIAPPRRRGGGRRFGQHFLHDRSILARIADSAQVEAGDHVVEIGAGKGALTRHLADRVGDAGIVLAIELDPILNVALEDLENEFECVARLQGDVLKTDLADATRSQNMTPPVKVVGNLPYYITTPVLEWLIRNREVWSTATVLVQDEVARRITAAPGTKACGSISVYVQYYCETSYVFRIAPGAFSPPPKVQSAVLRLVRRGVPAVAVDDEARFFTSVRAAFGQRRKTIRNALRGSRTAVPEAALDVALAAAEIEPMRRGETLSMDEFGRLSNALSAALVPQHEEPVSTAEMLDRAAR